MTPIPVPFSGRPLSDWIVQLQHSEVAEERVRALQAIGRLAEPVEAARWAAHALGDPDATVKALAAKLMGQAEVPNSVEAEAQLAALLDDSDPDVRFESARALARRKSHHADRAVPVLFAFQDEMETHALMLAAVINALVEIDLQQSVADEEFRPRLIRLLDHDRAEVREAVSTAFAKWPKMSATCAELLLPLLDDSEPIVRENIAKTLGQAGIAHDAIVKALQLAAQDEDEEVARVATIALNQLRP